MTETEPETDINMGEPHGTGETLTCPYCDWSQDYDPDTDASRIAAEVDAEIHWEREHGNIELPPSYKFGHFQCPSCKRMDGLEGTASCKHCGFIPEDNRA